ncbi:divalent metal cation transporter MntH [Massilia sp. WF1]|uniref:Nramp family divalent metal transporter n=1 Tax=unclassified Massilia TaxID=2609279 RepID=UPI000649C1F1|nr:MULTISPECIES: Nramp family divalent metal transporter [unclassified Massilia]ALK96230.1 divalent metal cation transporter [Massilia sp. WG5]KLU36203.1 divalent metal cation transporter MntH [Massilia sp. WF1]
MLKRTDTATVPLFPDNAPLWKKVLRFSGPGLLVSVGYMDPGNWATAIQGGSQFGYGLLFVVVLSSLAAIVLQCLSMRLGIVTGKDLAVHCREQYSPATSRAMWLFAELSIVACDLAEVLGCALAFNLLLGVPLPAGVALTALDTVIVLSLRGRGFRQLEAIVLGLIATIAVCLFWELVLVKPDWQAVAAGVLPSLHTLAERDALYLAVGILGATVMPHNLYLHSSVVQSSVPQRDLREDPERMAEAIGLSRIDTIVSLMLALFINGAILVLAAAAFYRPGGGDVMEIEQAYKLLAPVAGTALAAILFGLALLAAGQSSTFTGTIAGQVILEGFLELRIPQWQRRLITRALALGPAMVGVLTLGEHAIGRMLVASQVVLSLQLPFAMYPLIRLTGRPDLMERFANRWWTSLLSWFLFAVISGANLWMVWQAVSG